MKAINGKMEDNDFARNSMEKMSNKISSWCQNKKSVKFI